MQGRIYELITERGGGDPVLGGTQFTQQRLCKKKFQEKIYKFVRGATRYWGGHSLLNKDFKKISIKNI